MIFAGAVLAVAAIYVCARAGPVPVTPATPTGSDLAACTRLIGDLPATLAGQSSRPTTPPSGLTAAWGRPAITLRCGLTPRPAAASQGEFDYGVVANGPVVAWFQDPFDSKLFVTHRRPVLAVSVPSADSYDDVLGSLSAIVLGQPGSG